jgi:hypothetical protein
MNKLLTTLCGIAVTFGTTLAAAQEVTGNAQAGERKIAMCEGRHGIKG